MADNSEIDRILAQYGPPNPLDPLYDTRSYLADYLQRSGQPEPNRLAGPPMLPDVRPREMRSPPLGQGNALDRIFRSFGQPSLDALREGYAGRQTPAQVARAFIETGPIGPFGTVRSPFGSRLAKAAPDEELPSPFQVPQPAHGLYAYGRPSIHEAGAIGRQADQALSQGRFVTTDVPLNRLTATQEGVTASSVQGFLTPHGPIDAPVVVRINGVDYIHDGHHRLAAEVARGRASARARLINLDE